MTNDFKLGITVLAVLSAATIAIACKFPFESAISALVIAKLTTK